MKNTIKLFLILFVFSGIPAIIQAQINLRPGYIISNENDSIYGFIDFRTSDRNARQCVFKNPLTGETKTYHPGDIYAYRFTDDGRFYVTRTVTINEQPQTLFLEYIIQGIISLYYYRGDEPIYFFETEDGRMIQVSEKEEMIHKESGALAVKKDMKYIGVLNYLFSESDKAKKKMKNTSFNRDYFAELTKDYHYEVCETGEECIEFEAKKDSRYINIKFSARTGVKIMTFDVSPVYKAKMKSAAPFVGVDADFSIPRLTRIFSVHVGVDASKFFAEKLKDISQSRFSKFVAESFLLDAKIGLRIKPFRGKIVPFLEGGFCNQFLIDRSIRTETEMFEISGIGTSEHDYNSIVPTSLRGYYVNAGLELKLNKTHTLSIMGGYYKGTDNAFYMETWSGGVGFTF